MSSDLLFKCRTCLSDSNFYHQLFDYVEENYRILEMLDSLVHQIDIKCNTQFSTLICQTCVDKLLTGYKFQRLCIETNNRLHDLMGIAVFDTETKLEKLLDPLTEEIEQEIKKGMCYEQEIALAELEVTARKDTNDDWPPASSVYVPKETNVDKIDTLSTENNIEKYKPKESFKEEYEIILPISKETMDESETNGELFNEYLDEPYKGVFVKPVRSTEDVDFINIGVVQMKKPKSSNRKKRKYSCEVCGRVFDRPFNLKRHRSIHSAKVQNTGLIDSVMAKKEKLRNSNYSCKVCGMVFNCLSNLKRHSSRHSANVPNIDSSMGKIKKHNDINKKQPSYPCEVCGRVFNRFFNLKRHSSIHPANDLNIVFIDTDMGEIEKTQTKSRNFKGRTKVSSSDLYKVQKEKRDNKLVYKDKKFDKSTKVDKIETQETEYNKEKDEPRVCVKEELEIIPEVHETPMNESKENNEFFSYDNEYFDERSDMDKKFDTSTKVDKIETQETEYNKEEVESRECVKEGLKIIPEVLETPMNVSKEINQLISFDNEYSDEKSDKVKPIKSTRDLDFIDTSIAEIKKKRNFPCEVCGMIFFKRLHLERHSVVHSSSRPHECKICKYRFETLSAFSGHLIQHEEKQTSLLTRRPRNPYCYTNYPCMVCRMYFKTLKGLTQHIIEKHPDLESHECDQCEKTFVLHALLVEHLNHHKGNNNVVCLICEEEFGSTNDLTKHMRTHSDYANTLTDHMPKPSDEGLHLCPQCGKTFSKETHLRLHLPRHSEIKKYQCPECPKRFNCKFNLMKHTKIHTNAKPYVCDVCGSRFTRAASMRNHKLKHSGEKPFKCDQCSLAFAISYGLRRHMRTHTGEKPYKCKYCERAFSQSGDLAKHLRTHIGENIYMCDQCPISFKYQVELRHHQSEHYKMAQKLLQQAEQMSTV